MLSLFLVMLEMTVMLAFNTEYGQKTLSKFNARLMIKSVN